MEVPSIFAPVDVRSRHAIRSPTSIMQIAVLEISVVCVRSTREWFGQELDVFAIGIDDVQ